MIMKKNKIYIIFSLLSILINIACDRIDPLASEQYQKNIYIIGANNRVASFEVPYGKDQPAFISISASGSLTVDQDVSVILKSNDALIDWYNKKYMLDKPVKYQRLNLDLVKVPSWTTTLQAGKIYTKFPFTITTEGLHCDSLYAVTFSIDSVSKYQKADSGTELIFTLKLTNAYSGDYQMNASKIMLIKKTLSDGTSEWEEQGLAIPVVIQRTLTAVSADTIRFFHEKTKETLAEYQNTWNPGKEYFDAIDKYCIMFCRIKDSNKFTVKPWGSMGILDGEAEFLEGDALEGISSETEQIEKMFTFWYDYMDGSTRYRIKGTFKK